MAGTSGPYWPYPERPAPPTQPHPRRWLLVAGIAIVAVVAVAAVVWFVLPPVGGRYAAWIPLGGLFLIFIVLWLSFAIIRMSWWNSRRQRAESYRQYRRQGPPRRWDPAVQSARQRYARGEISRDEYERLIRDLRSPDRLP